jgi:hypothetical protein
MERNKTVDETTHDAVLNTQGGLVSNPNTDAAVPSPSSHQTEGATAGGIQQPQRPAKGEEGVPTTPIPFTLSENAGTVYRNCLSYSSGKVKNGSYKDDRHNRRSDAMANITGQEQDLAETKTSPRRVGALLYGLTTASFEVKEEGGGSVQSLTVADSNNSDDDDDDDTPVVEAVNEEDIRRRVVREVPYGTLLQSGRAGDDAMQQNGTNKTGLPNYQDHHHDNNSKKRRTVRCAVLFIVMGIILAAALGVLAGGESRTDEGRGHATYPPTDDHPLKSTRLFQFLKDETIELHRKFGSAATQRGFASDNPPPIPLEYVDSPQFVAFTWLIDHMDVDSFPETSLEQELLLERYAMATFYFSAGGPRWNTQLDFMNTSTSVCDWDGVSGSSPHKIVICNNFLQVRALNVPKGTGLQGSNIPPTELAFLSQMKILNLHDDAVSPRLIGGTLPVELCRWSDLESFSVPRGELSGTLPPEYGTGWKKLSKSSGLTCGKSQIEITEEILSSTSSDPLFPFAMSSRSRTLGAME